jgi:hypothetical protein
MARKVSDTITQIKEIEKLNNGLIDYSDILSRLEDELLVHLSAKKHLQLIGVES